MILILSNSLDVHADRVEKYLADSEKRFARINFDEFLKKKFSYRLSKQEVNCSLLDNLGVNIENDVEAVWLRRPLDLDFEPNDITTQIVCFEHNEFVRNIISNISRKAMWVSEPYAIAMAENKLNQLLLAKKLGLEVPDTLVTNSPIEADMFFTKHNGFIVKSLGNRSIKFGKKMISPTTKLVSDRQLLNHVESYPAYLQEVVEKQYEFRVTIMGKKLFAVKIDTQADPRSQLDSRMGDVEKLKHELVELPGQVRDALLEMNRYYGLNYSAIDMAFNNEGKYVLFELNPNGQYAWMDDISGVNLSKEMALLLEGKTEPMFKSVS